jgi:hypothetical protein
MDGSERIDVNTELNKDKILERGKFIANGYTFTIKPIYLGEEDSYLGDLAFSPIPISGDNEENEPLTEKEEDKKLNSHIITLFSGKLLEAMKKEKPKLTLWQKILKKFSKKYYYIDNQMYSVTKWLQKKVYYKNRPVTFYSLERKYNLSKADIERMIIYLHELSGF